MSDNIFYNREDTKIVIFLNNFIIGDKQFSFKMHYPFTSSKFGTLYIIEDDSINLKVMAGSRESLEEATKKEIYSLWMRYVDIKLDKLDDSDKMYRVTLQKILDVTDLK